MPLSFTMKLEPRSMCSMTVIAHSAIMTTNHVFPIVLHHSVLGLELKQDDASSMVWDKGRD